MTRILTLAILVVAAAAANAAGPYQGPVQGPVQAPGPKMVVETLPVCCNRCIDYTRLRPRCAPCGPHHEVVMLVKDNWACCFVELPLCLPECCLGEPQVCYKGRHVVEYSWTSGYKVRVILTKRGKVLVHYNVA